LLAEEIAKVSVQGPSPGTSDEIKRCVATNAR
jgi:hypothetical protein